MATTDDELDQLLKNLKLGKILEILERELTKAQKTHVSYRDFLARLLREEYQHQRERSVEARIRRAQLPERWALETYPFARQPAVPAATVRQFAELDFLAQGKNLVLIGPTGVGKTGLASAILLKALQNGHRGLFIKAQDLYAMQLPQPIPWRSACVARHDAAGAVTTGESRGVTGKSPSR